MAAHDRMPQMTTIKAKAFYMLVGVALTVFVLYPTLKQTFREQKDGLLLSPEEVKSTCGKPQVDDLYTLTYVDGDRRVVLQFMGANHRMFLNNVKWTSSKGGVGEIRQVTKVGISDFVKHGWLPVCLEDLAR
jgi:hypothetical protein